MQELATRSNSLPPLGNHPLVTIIVASYNQEDYIEDTMASVLNQDYDSIELLVVDGGSNDRTVEVIRSYENDPRLRWISEPDNGINDAFKKGLKMAKGSIIGLQPSSDTYTPWAIREAVEEFAADPQLAFVGGGIVQEIDVSGHSNGETWRSFDERHYYSVDDIVSLANYPAEQATFFRRDIALAIDGGGLEFKWLHTFFFLHYMLETSRLGARSLCAPRHWGNYRRHPGALHHELATRVVGLAWRQEQNQACKQTSKRYKDYLTPEQVKELRRPGYLSELRYRVGTLRQIMPAIPALWGYLRFGGRHFRPQGKGWVSYLASFMVGWLFSRVPKSGTSPHLK